MTATYDEVLISLGLEPSEKPSTRGCGTHASYVAHLTRGEEPCDPCREANNAYKRDRFHAEKPADLPPIQHGTPNGARRHWYRRETPCVACRRAYNADNSARQRRARQQARETLFGGDC